VTGWSSASGAALAGLADGVGAAGGEDAAAGEGAAGEGAAGEGAAGSGVAAAAGRRGAAAARWPAPEVRVSPTPSPVMASNPAAATTADRKLTSSIRA
jgi:hypothetical protein